MSSNRPKRNTNSVFARNNNNNNSNGSIKSWKEKHAGKKNSGKTKNVAMKMPKLKKETYDHEEIDINAVANLKTGGHSSFTSVATSPSSSSNSKDPASTAPTTPPTLDDSRDEEALETENGAETLKKWEKIVREEWELVSQQYDEQTEDKAEGVFESIRSDLKRNLSHRFRTSKRPVPFNLDRSAEPPKGASWCGGRSVEKGGKGYRRQQIRVIRPTKCVPSVMAWLPLRRNMAVEDSSTLTHLPSLTGADTDPDFVQDLIGQFENRVHGISSNGDFISDRILFTLLQNLKQIWAKELGKSSANINAELPFAAYKAVSMQFPDKGSARVLRKTKYPDLLARYAPVENAELLRESMAPNLDKPSANALPREKALHSYMSLFCPRCFIYDCFLHGSEPGPIPFKRKINDAEKEEYRQAYPLVPCSNTCHLNINKESNSHDMRSPKRRRSAGSCSPNKSQDSTLDLSISPGVAWENSEISLFRVMRGIYGDDYCAIQQGMMTNKTCLQVKELAQQEGPMSPLLDAKSPQMPKHGKKSKNGIDQHHRFRLMKWTAEDSAGQVSNRYPYHPCAHEPGEKCDEHCPCRGRQVLCMKFCKCPPSCTNRFPGCRCKARCTTKQCPCFMAYRECDPDMCTSCGACEIDVNHQQNQISCKNLNIQRGLGKKLLQGPSEVSGWGMFLGEAVGKNEFVSEYCGEIISQEEADRRGKIYDREQAVDATRKGNKIRFANHSSSPNCFSKVLMVNGDHRIGIFAKADLKQGEELFFDYSYRGEQLKFVSIERHRAAANSKVAE